MASVVTGPLVITKREDGSDLYLYEGAPVPEHLSTEECSRLEGLGLIGRVDEKAKSSKPSAESN